MDCEFIEFIQPSPKFIAILILPNPGDLDVEVEW